MLINGEKVYLYSPFDVKRWTYEEIEKECGELNRQYNPNADTMYELSLNVETLSNICYLFGEIIARTNKEHAMKKLEVDAKENRMVYTLRNQWDDGKAPAIKYFESQAAELVADERRKELELKEMCDRFKRAYEAYSEMINAIKKKMDSIKYEEFGGMHG